MRSVSQRNLIVHSLPAVGEPDIEAHSRLSAPRIFGNAGRKAARQCHCVDSTQLYLVEFPRIANRRLMDNDLQDMWSREQHHHLAEGVSALQLLAILDMQICALRLNTNNGVTEKEVKESQV